MTDEAHRLTDAELEALAERLVMSARLSNASYETCADMDAASNALLALRERAEAAEQARRDMHRRAQIAEGRLYRMMEYLSLWRESKSGDYWFRRHIDNILKGPRRDSGAWRTLLWCFWRKELDELRLQLTQSRAAVEAARLDGWRAGMEEAAKECDEYSKDNGTGMFERHSSACADRIRAFAKLKEPT